MTTLEKLFAGIIILIAVVAFFALVNYLGGYGALLGACIIAGLVNWGVEESTEFTDNNS